MSRYLFIGFFFLLSGCTHLHYDRVPATYDTTKNNSISQSDQTDTSRLQIIITRGPINFTHSTIRLYHNNKVIMWDPAGTYGLIHEYPGFYTTHPLPDDYKRVNDLIVAGIPSVSLYWEFAKFTGDNGMEVFEWHLDHATAEKYYNILNAGAFDPQNKYEFSTKHVFELCSSSATRFITTYAQDTIALEETYFFPDNLAHVLYQNNPDKIIIFDVERDTLIYTP